MQWAIIPEGLMINSGEGVVHLLININKQINQHINYTKKESIHEEELV